jgi:hypothetical protein
MVPTGYVLVHRNQGIAIEMSKDRFIGKKSRAPRDEDGKIYWGVEFLNLLVLVLRAGDSA